MDKSSVFSHIYQHLLLSFEVLFLLLGVAGVTWTTKPKNFWCRQLACWPVYSASWLNQPFPLFVYTLESPRLTPFTLQLNRASSTPFLSLTAREVNLPVTHTAVKM
jgi:hypothetical protein